jgi:lysozyme family protein
MQYTATAKAGYTQMFKAMVVLPSKQAAATAIAKRVIANKFHYDAIEKATGVPWWFIGVIHYRESNLDFATHLHNGDTLKARTVHVPAGRPLEGAPPFTWEASAIDALKMHKLDQVTDWSAPSALYQLEAYNGWGYVGKGVNSAYVWAGSSQYTGGKYIADGVFSYTAYDTQLGGAVIMNILMMLVPYLMPTLIQGVTSMVDTTTGASTQSVPGTIQAANTVTTDYKSMLVHHIITLIGAVLAAHASANIAHIWDMFSDTGFLSGLLLMGIGPLLALIGIKASNDNTLLLIDSFVARLAATEQAAPPVPAPVAAAQSVAPAVSGHSAAAVNG